MDQQKKAGPAAFEIAEKILRTIYGDDFTGCNIRLDTVADMVQEAVEVEAVKSKLLVTVLEQIQNLSTPPQVGEINDVTHLAQILGSRADGIRILSKEALQAWAKVNKIT